MNVLRITYPDSENVSRREGELVSALREDCNDLRDEIIDEMSDAIGSAGSDVPSLNKLRDFFSDTAAQLRKTNGKG